MTLKGYDCKKRLDCSKSKCPCKDHELDEIERRHLDRLFGNTVVLDESKTLEFDISNERNLLQVVK